MEIESSHRQTVGDGLPSSFRLSRANSNCSIASTIMPDIPPFTSNSGRKSFSRSTFSTSTRSRNNSSSKSGEENINPSTTLIGTPGIIKKPQESLIRNSIRKLQRHRKSDAVKAVEKVKTKSTTSVFSSAWALSSGRSSSIIPVPAFLSYRTKPRLSNVSSVLNRPESPDCFGRSKPRLSDVSSVLNLPESPDCSGRRKPRSSRVGSILKYFLQKKTSPVQEEAFHQLRLMHTRVLQWRFVNARAESNLSARKNFAEEELFKVWQRIFNLRNSIGEKRLQIQQLKNEMKIIEIINPQVCILNEWEMIEKKHSEAVGRIGRKLLASSNSVPLINDAKVDTDSLQNAMLEAIGIMDGIEASISKFILQVEEAGSLAYELVNTLEQERKGLEELKKGMAILGLLEGTIQTSV
ncbi:hypothetical protein NE237_013515 [Protea cynaroides]|uniref:Uncharacterized protein n=1 Tax=Protea cynaroides TaxID=273540 RepID=A0A9Q0JZ26_9MAGN|nr:hypothetical protein NE237_013515 [Protea cynaroides]